MKLVTLNALNHVIAINADLSANALQLKEAPDDCQIGWVYRPDLDGFYEIDPNSLDVNKFQLAIAQLVDSVAQSKQYKDAASIATYVSSTNVQWAAEAQAFIAWRDTVYIYALQELPKFQSNERPVVSVPEFLNELPIINWPI